MLGSLQRHGVVVAETSIGPHGRCGGLVAAGKSITTALTNASKVGT